MKTKQEQQHYWSRHGSTRYINDFNELQECMNYVRDCQGETLTYFESGPILFSNSQPLAFFVTFNTYGSWLPGDDRGYVNRKQYNAPNTPLLPPSLSLRLHIEKNEIKEKYLMDEKDREIVLKAIIEVCEYRKWFLHIVHVRTNHIHVIVSADERPEKVMNDFKAYASRALNMRVKFCC